MGWVGLRGRTIVSDGGKTSRRKRRVSGDQMCGQEDAIRQREDAAGTEERKRGYEGLRLGLLTPRMVKTLLQVCWTTTGTQYEMKTRILDATARTAVTKIQGTDFENEGRLERRGGKVFAGLHKCLLHSIYTYGSANFGYLGTKGNNMEDRKRGYGGNRIAKSSRKIA